MLNSSADLGVSDGLADRIPSPTESLSSDSVSSDSPTGGVGQDEKSVPVDATSEQRKLTVVQLCF